MSFPKTILMIEDDAPTREVVRMACVGQNLNLIEADTGEKGMEMIEKSEPDLVILDLNLPGVSGMDVCRQLRADGTQVPVIMLTAKNDTIDVAVGAHVYRLRKKIGRDSEKPHYIHSVPGIGYRFVAD